MDNQYYVQPQYYQPTNLTQQSVQQKQQNNNGYLSNVPGDVAFGGVIGGGIGAFTHTTNKTGWAKALSKGKAFGAYGVAGALSSVPFSVVNSVTSDMSNGLASYYGKKDKNGPTLAHTGLVALPAVAGGVYALGAITHGIDAGKNLMKAKSFKEAGKHALDALNPKKHIQRGYSETIKSVKDLFDRKRTFGARGMGLLNLVGIAASALPAVLKYRSEAKKNSQNNQLNNINMNRLGYIDDTFNALSAATASKPLLKSAAYFPVITPLTKARNAAKEIKKLKRLGEEHGFYVENDIARKKEEMRKSLKNAGYDALGATTLAGVGVYLYKKKQEPQLPQLRGMY